ncbi:MAG TPA: thiosulfate oxidation carrier protein SoxY [Burkholderiaceae bacterium]|nr:thiosulfate oxidation carrier protein SoxY [Burkholderiaceae bacterium]
MDQLRRDTLRISSVLGLAVAAGLLGPINAAAEEWNKDAFDAKNYNDALKGLGAVGVATSKELLINAPDIAENGAVVPVTVSATLPNVQQIAILIDKNPFTLSANFTIPAGTEPSISTRVKMRETSNVYALVKANGKWFVASKEIKVTLGGCGG